MAGETVVQSGDNFLDVRWQSVSLQSETLRQTVFVRMMAGKQPKQKAALAKRERLQTSSDMPIVMIHDLEQAAGDTVTCDMFRTISGKAFMGDKKMQGQGRPIRFSSMETKINQTRFPIDAGGKMTNKRTKHNLRKIARANMSDWFARQNDQVIQVHMAGTRGSENTEDWNVPLADDEDFADILINPVEAPTRNRRFIVGGHKSIADIMTTDVLRLRDIDVIATTLREMPFPPMPIKVDTDPMGDEERIWCLMVTERQWLYLQLAAGTTSQTWRKFQADAMVRAASTKQHPLFRGTAGLWNGILIKKMPRPIRLAPGFMLKETQTDGTESDVAVPANTSCDRAILLGGQALAMASGNAGNNRSPFPMFWNEELTDHKNALEIGAGMMDGKKKFRFTQSDGESTDFGIATLDSYAPDQNSDAGRTLANTLLTVG